MAKHAISEKQEKESDSNASTHNRTLIPCSATCHNEHSIRGRYAFLCSLSRSLAVAILISSNLIESECECENENDTLNCHTYSHLFVSLVLYLKVHKYTYIET